MRFHDVLLTVKLFSLRTHMFISENQAERKRRKMLIRNKWQLAYTLVRNPVLLTDRLSHLCLTPPEILSESPANQSESAKAVEVGSIAVSISEVSVVDFLSR